MLINLSEIMSVKDKVQHSIVPIDMEHFKLDGTEYHFVKKEPVDITITCIGDHEVSIAASTEVSLMLPCSRCLEEVETPFHISVSKDIVIGETAQDKLDDGYEVNCIVGYDLDVDKLVYDEMLIEFPLRVLCSEDCKGICNVCGMNLNKGNCECDRTVGDPRMMKFQDIFKNFKEV